MALDRPAFEREILRLLDQLYSFARWLAREDDAARDLVQDTVVQALQAREGFEAGTNLRAWLFRIARNRFLDLRARRQREPLGEIMDPSQDGARDASGAEALLGDRELARLQGLVRGDITRALETLPEVYRMAILLTDVEGWTWAEAAEMLGVPVGTVQSRVFRGRRALRLLLKDYAPA